MPLVHLSFYGGDMAAKEGVKTRGRKPKSPPRQKFEYVAVARFMDNETQLFHVRNAYSLEDARQLVLDEVGSSNVRCLLISARELTRPASG